MATYNLREGIPEAFLNGDVLNYPYRLNSTNYGGTLQLNLPKGIYRLEAWGCASGASQSWAIGTGGYAAGTLELSETTASFLCAGGSGTNGAKGAGGGASDIRLLQNNLYNRVLTAGGGGATGASITINPTTGKTTDVPMKGGYGGGTSGEASGEVPQSGGGGTQTSGGSNGSGFESYKYIDSGFGTAGWIENAMWGTVLGRPGGGGWYGGGSGGMKTYSPAEPYVTTEYHGGGGGSGFVLTSSTIHNAPSGYRLGSDYYMTDAVNKSGHDTGNPITEPDGTSSEGHYGEGYIRITVIVGQLHSPGNITVTEPSEGDLSLSFGTVTNATAYEIYDGNDNLLATLTSSPYTQTGITQNTNYTWKIVATSDEYAASAPTVVNYRSKPKLSRPKNLAAEYTVSSTKISWSAVSGATSYAITKDGASAGSVSTPSYTDSSAGESSSHVYTVMAQASGRWDSPVASITTANPPQLDNVTNLSASQTVSSVTLTWTAPAGATSYVIYRDGKKVGTSTTTRYKNNGTVPGTTYKYTVIAKASGYYDSSGKSVKISIYPRLETPDLVESGQTTSSVDLSWAIKDYGATVTFTLRRDGELIYQGSSTSLTDEGLLYGSTYEYTLVAAIPGSTYYDSLPATVRVLVGRDYSTTDRQKDYLKSLRRPYTKLCRLRFLNPNNTTAFTLDNNPMNKRSRAFIASGTVTANLQNGQRYTATVTLDNVDGDYETAVNKIWFGQRVALDEGLILSNGEEYYRQTGVFLIDNPNEKIDPQTNTVTYRLLDKWAALDGTLGGNLEGTYEVAAGTNIFTPMEALLQEDTGNGEPIDDVQPVFTEYYNDKTQELTDGTTVNMTDSPYTLTVSGDGGTKARVLLGLAGMVNAWIGYDNTGRLRIDPSQDDILDIQKPVLWRFTEEEAQLLGMSYTVKKEDVYNDYIVVGEQLDDYSQPGGRATNYDPRSDTNVNLIGRRTKRESASGYATTQQCKDLAEWRLKRSSVLQRAVSISCTQMMHIDLNSLVEIVRTDKEGSPVERHLIQGFSRPLAYSGAMTISAVSVNDLPVATVTGWPEQE